jgi:DNA-binding response OmpR family regulator
VDVCVAKDEPAAALINSVRVLGRMPPRAATHVLVVEDDPDTRHFMRTALEDDGLDTVATGDAVEALAECSRRTPGVVVLDLGLPKMSGRDFVTAYRRMPGHEAPIVVVSAATDAPRIAADLGAAAFLPKPFSIDQLTEAVRRVRRPQIATAT